MLLKTNELCADAVNNISIEILISGYLIAGTEWYKTRSLPPHYSKLYFILGGDAYIISGGKRTDLRPGHAYLIPSDLIYDNGCETGIHFLYFNIRLVNSSGYDFLAEYPYPLECEYPAEKTLELVSKYISPDLSDSLSLKSELMRVLLNLLSGAPEVKLTTHRYSSEVSRALGYIHENLSINMTTGDICKAIFAARSTLKKKFSEEVGMPIGTYIDTEVMSGCRQLLIETDMQISRISERYGFCDQFYFSRRFKEKFGVTPQKYRKMNSL